MNRRNYILDGKTPTLENNISAWANWFKSADRKVARDTIGTSVVSTVFLGLDHSFSGGLPLLFETMVFDGPLDGEQNRCSTWEEAEQMHKVMCERVSGVLAT